MASTKSKAEYEQDRLDVIDDLKDAGSPIEFGNYPDATDGLGGKSNILQIVESGFCFPLDFQKYFGGDVQEDDLFFITSGADLTGLTHIQYLGNSYRIIKKKPFMPDAETLIYNDIQVRR